MQIKNILVPTDFSPGSQAAVRYAFDLAVRLDAALHIMHVVENPFAPGAFMEMYSPPPPEFFLDLERQAQEKLLSALTPDEQRQVSAVLTTTTGAPTSEILARLAQTPTIDLVVMATHGRGGVARMVMGSVTDKIVRSAECPILTLRDHPQPTHLADQEVVAGAVQ
jgi:nucleotide-binding universal stress UspA family protein